MLARSDEEFLAEKVLEVEANGCDMIGLPRVSSRRMEAKGKV